MFVLPGLPQVRRCLLCRPVPPQTLQLACSFVYISPRILSSNFQVQALLLYNQLFVNITWSSVLGSQRQRCPQQLPPPLLLPSVEQYLLLLMNHLFLMMLTGMRCGIVLCARKFRPYALTKLGPWCHFTLQ